MRPFRRSRSIARLRRCSVKLPPSGKITNASFVVQVAASSPICADHPVAVLARVGPDEPVRQPVQHHVDRRVPLQGVLEHDARLAGVPVHQRVHEEERVARAGVPATGPAAAARRTTSAAGPRRRPARAAPAGLPEQDLQEPLHQVVVRPLEARRPDPPAEAAGHPQPEQHDQHHRLEQQVQQHHPEQPQRPPPAGQDVASAAATSSSTGRPVTATAVSTITPAPSTQPPDQHGRQHQRGPLGAAAR